MRSIKWRGLPVVLAIICLAGLASPRAARAQSGTSPADIQRLQDSVYDVSSDLSRLRGRDPAMADRLQGQLDMLREEAIYLKVKLRKEGAVSRNEFADVRDRLDDLRAQARGEARPSASRDPYAQPAPPPGGVYGGTMPPSSGGVAPPTGGGYGQPTGTGGGVYSEPDRGIGGGAPRNTRPNEVPVGTEIDVRLQSPLSSGSAQVEDRFQATTMVDLGSDSRVLIPAGSLVRGVVTSVDKAGRIERRGRLTLAFDQVTVSGRAYPMHATVTQALESEGIRGETGKIGAGAGVGAIIGGILGGFKGALAGILIGGGGTVAATEGKDVELPPGTVLRIRLDSPLTVR